MELIGLFGIAGILCGVATLVDSPRAWVWAGVGSIAVSLGLVLLGLDANPQL